MKFIENYRGKYLNQEFWILGCGPSLDDYPDDFFDEKTSIAINWSIIAFPNCTYWHCSHPEVIIYMRDYRPEILEKSILLMPFVPFLKTHQKMLTQEETLNLLDRYKNDPIFVRWRPILGRGKLFQQYLKPTVQCIMQGKACSYICYSTIVHYAIQIAAVFGTKKITLVGCEGRCIENKCHAEKRGLREIFEPEFRRRYIARGSKSLGVQRRELKEKGSRYVMGTRLLAQAFKLHGIVVMRYYYKTGYEKIV